MRRALIAMGLTASISAGMLALLPDLPTKTCGFVTFETERQWVLEGRELDFNRTAQGLEVWLDGKLISNIVAEDDSFFACWAN